MLATRKTNDNGHLALLSSAQKPATVYLYARSRMLSRFNRNLTKLCNHKMYWCQQTRQYAMQDCQVSKVHSVRGISSRTFEKVSGKQHIQAHRQGVRGGSLKPPCWPSKKFIYTAITVHFKWPTVGKWSTSSSLAGIQNHCCPSKSGKAKATCKYVRK